MCHSNRPCTTTLPGNLGVITFTVGPTPGDIIGKSYPTAGIITVIGSPYLGDITSFFQEKSDVPELAREGGGTGLI